MSIEELEAFDIQIEVWCYVNYSLKVTHGVSVGTCRIEEDEIINVSYNNTLHILITGNLLFCDW